MSATEPTINGLDDLASRLESLRTEYHIPALAAGVLQEDGSVWFKGLGTTSQGTAPTAQSVFHLASLTKSFASAVVLRLAAEGKLSLDDNISKYGLSFSNSPNILVVHLMTHTSEGVPGQNFLYNGDRYAQLDKVIQVAAGKSFVDVAQQQIMAPLGLTCTGPSSDAALRARLIPGFNADGKTTIQYPTTVSSAAGFVSCVQDMLTYSAAWDAATIVNSSSVERAWTAARNSSGTVLPYGLGWFVDEIDGQKIVWHYGLWTGISSLIIKIPARHVTYVLLANSDQLSAQFALGSGDLRSSPFARAFLSWAQIR